MDSNHKSIGIYCYPNCVSTECSPIEMHINLWSIRGGNGKDFYAIDFGIKFKTNIKKLLLLLPFVCTNSDVEDLGERLGKNQELLCSVFHETYGSSTNPTNTVISITDNQENKVFGIYKLSNEGSLKVQSNKIDNKYTELYIEPDCDYQELKEQGVEKLYVRFQIVLNSLSPFATNVPISNDFLQSAFSSSHLFDFRINDIRGIAPNIAEKIKKNGYTQAVFNKIHYFYMSEVTETVDNGSRLHLDTRMLEKEVWQSYLHEKTNLDKDHLAYHWKKLPKEGKTDDGKSKGDASFESFTLFYKTTYTYINRTRVAKYVAIVLLLGILASSLISAITAIPCLNPNNGKCYLLIALVIISISVSGAIFYIIRRAITK